MVKNRITGCLIMIWIVMGLYVPVVLVLANGDVEPELEVGGTHFLDDVVVTAMGREERVSRSVRAVSVADFLEIQQRSPLSLMDILDDRVGIWIEKRTATTSDPVLRGLSGGNILALVDRNSLTTMWGEGGFAGDDMYGKIDTESVGRVEVVRGPASVLYGSNALGGVVNLITREPPIDYTDSGFGTGGRLKGGFGTASNYKLGRIENWGATPRMRYLVGVSARDIQDMRAGGGTGKIRPSGGEDHSVDLKSEFKVDEGRFIDLGTQVMRRPEVFRSYRPNEVNENERAGVALGYRTEMVEWTDSVELRGYYQRKEDRRAWLDSEKRGEAQWDTFSADMQLKKRVGETHWLTGGLHAQTDLAESPDDEQFTIWTPDMGEQKASPDTEWNNVGVFLQDEWSFAPRWRLIPSYRYDHFWFEADDTLFYTIPGSTSPDNRPTRDPGEFTEDSHTGGLGLAFDVTESWSLMGSWFRGYRLFPPSFGLRQLGYGVLAPNGLLDPVTGDTYELSTRVRGEVVSATVTGYFTDFNNFQQPIPGSYDGMTAYDFDGNGAVDPDEQIYVNAANGDAYVQGVEVECEVDLGGIMPELNGWRFFPGFMWNEGRMEFPGTAEEPLRHTHPMRGLFRLRYDDPKPRHKWWLELSADVVARYDAISESRLTGDVGYRSDPQDPSSPLVRDYGLPGYTVFDARAGYSLTETTQLSVSLDNIFDKEYRTAHSRMDAEGRSLWIALEVWF